ncbi:MAG: hypothetical protein Q8R28_03400, partial [Dehalococcoidia bacterium]|nr:hypothetical protein [Dehalococcoidia bacterium]
CPHARADAPHSLHSSAQDTPDINQYRCITVPKRLRPQPDATLPPHVVTDQRDFDVDLRLTPDCGRTLLRFAPQPG